MRWNCPHCGTALAISESKFKDLWAFSQCYRCSGVALVRRSDMTLIKVDRAPRAEELLLPEPPEQPLLSGRATEHLAQLAARLPKRPAILSKPALPPPMPELPCEETAPKGGVIPAITFPTITFKDKLIPVATLLASIVAIISGTYLYLQARTLFRNTPPHRRHEAEKQAMDSVPRISQVEIARIDPPQTAEARPSSQAPPQPQAQAPTQPPLQEDQLHEQAGAPSRLPITAKAAAQIEVLADDAKLRAGPGVRYPIISIASVGARYPLVSLRERWVKIEISPVQTAWIRNDLVRIASP